MKRFLLLFALLGVCATVFAAPAAPTKATVYVFVGNSCPVSNSYAPELERLYQTYRAKGVAFTLVNEDAHVTAAQIAAHNAQYKLTVPTVLDAGRALAKQYAPAVTPEAVVVSPAGKVVYTGRIDNKYADFGKVRPQATTHDLRDALDAVLAGKPVLHPVTKAVGCFL